MMLPLTTVTEVALWRRDAVPAINNIPTILAITACLTAIALFAVLLRFYVRLVMLKNFGADDWVMALTAASATAVLVCWVEETKTGIGWHIDDVNKEQQKRLTKIMFIHGVINMNAVTFVKISVALNLRRFMQSRRQRTLLAGLVVFLLAFTIMCSCTIIFTCVPVAASWDQSLAPTAKCYSVQVFKGLAINNSVINILTDFLLALLPVPIIIKLNTSLRIRVTLALILGLGMFAGTAAIVKAVKQFQFFSIRDYTWEAEYWIWHDIELTVGIVAASLPALRPLFTAFYDKTLKYSYGAATEMGYRPSNGYAPRYGQSTNRQYLRQKDLIDDDVAKTGITLQSFHDRDAFAGKRSVAQTHTAEVTSNGRKKDAEISYTDGRSGTRSCNDYDSDEFILHERFSESQMSHQPGHGIAEEVARPHAIVKTTTVQITRH